MSARMMLRVLSYTLLSTFFFWNLSAQDQYSYEGTAVCGMCHRTAKQGEQLQIWQKSAHSEAYKVLLSDKAKAIAKEKGLGSPEKEAACLKCHASGYDLPAARLGKRFSVEDGVQCETCHGPGSAYKSIKIMKDKQLAIKNGLQIHDDGEKFCRSCHNPESPTFVKFDYAEAWAKIKHPVPSQ